MAIATVESQCNVLGNTLDRKIPEQTTHLEDTAKFCGHGLDLFKDGTTRRCEEPCMGWRSGCDFSPPAASLVSYSPFFACEQPGRGTNLSRNWGKAPIHTPRTRIRSSTTTLAHVYGIESNAHSNHIQFPGLRTSLASRCSLHN